MWALVAGSLVALIIIGGVGYRNALASPIERQLSLTVPYPPRRAPLKLVLLSDVHVHGPDMPPARLARIVAQINRQRPDLVIAAGDFVGDNWVGAHYPIDVAVAPLRRLHARFGVFAVLGNNDHIAGRKKVMEALSAAHVRVLNNEAVRAGPIVLGGVDYQQDMPRPKALWALRSTLASMQRMPGLRVLIAHSPDVFLFVPPTVALVLAGHTHCGQVVVPFLGPILTGSRFGREFVCGVYRKESRVLVVTAGLGTSHLPIRFAAPPDFWLVEIHGRSS